jgi:hypothetical protein
MEIKKFEAFDSGEYDYEYGSHCFVLARPKDGWIKLLTDFGHTFKDDEFIPCLISGYGTQQVRIPGFKHSYNIKFFEIIKGSDKDIKNLIDLYLSTKKYNI